MQIDDDSLSATIRRKGALGIMQISAIIRNAFWGMHFYRRSITKLPRVVVNCMHGFTRDSRWEIAECIRFGWEIRGYISAWNDGIAHSYLAAESRMGHMGHVRIIRFSAITVTPLAGKLLLPAGAASIILSIVRRRHRASEIVSHLN